MLAGAEQPRRDRHMQLIDEPRREVLADRRHAAADLHILPLGGGLGSFHRLVDPTCDEVEDRAALHLDWRSVVMRQHEHRSVVRRSLPPPATPGIIGPGTTNRAEHVASHDPRADALTGSCRDVVIDAGRAPGLSTHALERAGRDEPFVQLFSTNAEGSLPSLTRAGAV